MTPLKTAVLLIRYYCIWAFVDVAIYLTELPGHVVGIMSSEIPYVVAQRKLALAMLAVKLLIFGGTGVMFLVWARPMAKLLTRDLENGAPERGVQGSALPGAERSG